MAHDERLFEGASEQAIEQALSVFQPVQVEAGGVIMEQEDPDPALLYLLSGNVGVWRDNVPLAQCVPGDVVGEMSLFTGRPRAATVRAIDDVQGLVLDRPGYDKLRESNNEIAFVLERLTIANLAERLRNIDRGIAASVPGELSPYKKPSAGLLERIRVFLFGDNPPEEGVTNTEFDAVGFVSRNPLFAGERSSFVTGVARGLEHRTYPAGHFLCTQGEPGDAMYLLARGTVEVLVDIDQNRIHRLATLQPGAAFGMTALIADEPRMASCVAADEVDVLVVDRAKWEWLKNESTRIASTLRVAMIRAFAAQLDAAGADYVRAQTGA